MSKIFPAVGALIVVVISCVSGLESYSADPLVSTSYGQSTKLTWGGDRTDKTVYRHLEAEVFFWSQTTCRIRIAPERTSEGQEMPYVVPTTVFEHSQTDASTFVKAAEQDYTVSVADLSDLVVASKTTQQEIFRIGDLRFREQELRLRFNVQTNSYLSGYGEHDYYYFLNHLHIRGSEPFGSNPPTNFATEPIQLGLWNTDNGGTPWHRPLYGVHPVLFVQQPVTSTFFAVFFVNSHAEGMTVNPTPFDLVDSPTKFHAGSQGIELTFIGGTIDCFIITGSSPLDIITQYHKLITPTMLPPYWSLGVHQSRWGYKDVAALKAVVAGYKRTNLPLEVMWTDIDYMDKFRIFTTDPKNYPIDELRPFIDELHANSQRYVQIVDPGVAQANYSVYWNGTAADVWVKMSDNKSALVNVVWPGWTVFPDFTSEVARDWWGQQMAHYFESVPLDGVWLDMNELGTFCGGSCNVSINQAWKIDWQAKDVWSTFESAICVKEGHCTRANSSLNYPPVNPTHSQYPFIFNRTLDMTGELAMGRYYNTKAFYGMMEEKATFDQLKKNKTRPFILSRATFVGSGKYTAHWTGDNVASWKPTTGGLSDSWQGIMSANLWGISMVGSDIGGYSGSSTKELITRWTQAGAFYTFMRNHHQKDDTNQEPYTCSNIEISAMRKSMFKRYELLPYIFTELAKSHFLGGPVNRHLSVQFPTDIATYVESNTMMLGDAILVVPVTEEGAQSVVSYLPRGPWYDIWTLSVASLEGHETKRFATPYDLGTSTVSNIPAMFRGGSILPLHTKPEMTVSATRATGVSLLAAFDRQNYAAGEGWFDDGKESILPSNAFQTTGKMLVMKYSCTGDAQDGQCSATTANKGPRPHSFPLSPAGTLATFTLLFPDSNFSLPHQVRVNGSPLDMTNVTMEAASMRIVLPAGVDGTTDFTLDWTMIPVYPPTPQPPPPPKGSPVVALAAVLAVTAIGFGVAVVAAFYFRKKAKDATDSDGFMAMM